MGFFNKPFKATKSFCKNPVKIIQNDLTKIDKGISNALGFRDNTTKSEQQCHQECFNNMNNNLNFADKKRIAKEVNDLVALSYCNKKCFK